MNVNLAKRAGTVRWGEGRWLGVDEIQQVVDAFGTDRDEDPMSNPPAVDVPSGSITVTLPCAFRGPPRPR